MSLRSYKARKMVLGSDFSSNTQEERIPFSAHVKNDQLQSQFFGLESKLKLLEYLEKEN